MRRWLLLIVIIPFLFSINSTKDKVKINRLPTKLLKKIKFRDRATKEIYVVKGKKVYMCISYHLHKKHLFCNLPKPKGIFVDYFRDKEYTSTLSLISHKPKNYLSKLGRGKNRKIFRKKYFSKKDDMHLEFREENKTRYLVKGMSKNRYHIEMVFTNHYLVKASVFLDEIIDNKTYFSLASKAIKTGETIYLGRLYKKTGEIKLNRAAFIEYFGNKDNFKHVMDNFENLGQGSYRTKR